MDFDAAWARYGPEIARLSRTQWVPGQDPDDVASEMSICLWRATQTYHRGFTPFGTYWWSLWLNRKHDLVETHNALKRIHAIPMAVLPERAVQEALFPMPPVTDELGVAIWGALGQGDTAVEVQRDLGISRRRYYDVIHRLRDRRTRDHLVD